MTISITDLECGQMHFTTRGIAVVEDFYTENDIEKVRIRLHTVDAADGVTATGTSLLMSTTPEMLCDWINRFPQDLAERKRTISTLKTQKVHLQSMLDGYLLSISIAEMHGPQLNQENGAP